MRRVRRTVVLLCSVAVGLGALASPVAAEYESPQCKHLAAAWKKAHPHATRAQKKAEAEKLATSHSCNFIKDLKAL